MKEKDILKIFRISLIVKGLQAIAELIGGVMLFFISTASITNYFSNIALEELTENQDNSLYQYLLNTAQHFSIADQSFLAVYLLSHGVVKAFLIGGIMKNKLWAYPAFVIIHALFIVYQLYRIFAQHSSLLVVLTIFDIVILWLVWHEYKIKKKHMLAVTF